MISFESNKPYCHYTLIYLSPLTVQFIPTHHMNFLFKMSIASQFNTIPMSIQSIHFKQFQLLKASCIKNCDSIQFNSIHVRWDRIVCIKTLKVLYFDVHLLDFIFRCNKKDALSTNIIISMCRCSIVLYTSVSTKS